MSLLSPGKLFLADQRGVVETAGFRRFSTFQFGAYVHAHKQPFGHLLALNEETLAGGQAVSVPAPEAAYLLVLPITGAVWAGTGPGPAARVDVAELHVLPIAAGGTVQFTNPYKTEGIHFVHVWVRAPAEPAPAQLLAFPGEGRPNQLVAARPVLCGPPARGLGPALPFRVHLGRFAGRAEATCTLPAGTTFFAFVLAGAFEIDGRLVHAGDGLALWDTPAVALGALSNDAVVVAVELAARGV